MEMIALVVVLAAIAAAGCVPDANCTSICYELTRYTLAEEDCLFFDGGKTACAEACEKVIGEDNKTTLDTCYGCLKDAKQDCEELRNCISLVPSVRQGSEA